MEKNLIIELIKQNRIAEAIDMLEKASIGTDTHHELILLASSFSDYAKKNRTATLDSHTLEMQRNQITNKVLYYLDEVPAEALSAIPSPPMRDTSSQQSQSQSHHTAQSFAGHSQVPAQKASPLKKYGLIGGGVIAVVVILFGLDGGDDYTEDTYEEPYQESQSALPLVDPGISQQEDEVVTYDEEESQVISEPIDPDYQEEANLDNYSFTYVTYVDSDRELEAAIYLDTPGEWILELEDGTQTSYREIDMDENSVTIHGEDGTIVVDILNEKILETFENEHYSYPITDYGIHEN